MILSVCDTPDGARLMSIVGTIILIIRIVVPIILIVSIMIDFTKVLFSKEDSLGKTISLAIKKIIVAILVFLIPNIVNIIFNIVDPNANYKECLDMAYNTKIENTINNKK